LRYGTAIVLGALLTAILFAALLQFVILGRG
jgi:hypothetical protein